VAGIGCHVAGYCSLSRAQAERNGSAMAVNDCGEVAGSVSGGCVEAAGEEAMKVLAGNPDSLPMVSPMSWAFSWSHRGDDSYFLLRVSTGNGCSFQRRSRSTTLGTAIGILYGCRGSDAGAKMAVPGDLNQPVIGSLGNRVDRVVTHDAEGCSPKDSQNCDVTEPGRDYGRSSRICQFFRASAPLNHLRCHRLQPGAVPVRGKCWATE